MINGKQKDFLGAAFGPLSRMGNYDYSGGASSEYVPEPDFHIDVEMDPFLEDHGISPQDPNWYASYQTLFTMAPDGTMIYQGRPGYNVPLYYTGPMTQEAAYRRQTQSGKASGSTLNTILIAGGIAAVGTLAVFAIFR